MLYLQGTTISSFHPQIKWGRWEIQIVKDTKSYWFWIRSPQLDYPHLYRYSIIPWRVWRLLLSLPVYHRWWKVYHEPRKRIGWHELYILFFGFDPFLWQYEKQKMMNKPSLSSFDGWQYLLWVVNQCVVLYHLVKVLKVQKRLVEQRKRNETRP